MARPPERGLEYFPLNISLTGNIEYVKCIYGKMGESVMISLWQRIYNNGFYVEYNDKSPLVFSQEFGEQLTACFPEKQKQRWEIYDEIIHASMEYSILDKDLFEKYNILTSAEIQEKYFLAKKKSKYCNLVHEYEMDYLLLPDVKERIEIEKNIKEKNNKNIIRSEIAGINSEITPVIEEETEINSAIIPQSKVNKSKVNKSKTKENDIKVNKKVNEKVNEKVNISDEPINQLINQSENNNICIDFYEKYIGTVTSNVCEGMEYYLSQGMERDLVIHLIEYVAEQSQIKHTWQYLDAVLKGNLNDGILTLDDYDKAKSDFIKNKSVYDIYTTNNAINVGNKKNNFKNYTPNKETATDFVALEHALEKEWGIRDDPQ